MKDSIVAYGPVMAFCLAVICSAALPWDSCVTAADLSARPPQDLDQVWNDMMLGGRFGRIRNGKVLEDYLTSRMTNSQGWVHEAPMTAWGIWVGDLRERHLLMSGGGWVMEGGLLSRISLGKGTIELYGKSIERHEPYFNPFPHVWFGNESCMLDHDFFLLIRPAGDTKAQVIRHWLVANSYDGHGGGPGRLVPRGSLAHDSVSKTITVEVMHGHYAGLFIERVDISNVDFR
jgi:hypothetical protein